MSTYAPDMQPGGEQTALMQGPIAQGPPPYQPDVRALLEKWGKRRTDSASERQKFETIWSICEHFLAGRQWVAVTGEGRSARVINEPNSQKRERHTVNLITSRVETIKGKLFVEDLRPTVTFSRDDVESESVTTHTRNLSKYMWDTEVGAEKKLDQLFTRLLCYGTVAGRCLFDSTRGQEIGMFPIGPDGQPIIDPREARNFVAQMQMMGRQAEFRMLREGKIVWEPLSPRNILPPPGVVYDDDFPWLIIERAMSVEAAELKWPESKGRLSEQNLRTQESLGAAPSAVGDLSSGGDAGRLKDHVLISTGYEMPCPEYPNGLTITWNAERKVLLDVQNTLPYKLRSEPHHGIVFFHYYRLPHRFWGRGVVEDLIGPQRQLNRARSQMIEMKDRNLGRVYVKKGTYTAANKPTGKIMEIIEVPLHADFPQETFGTPVGSWIENEARINKEDMDGVSGLGDVSLGNMPAGSTAYSALALQAQMDDQRVGPILKMLRFGIGDMVVLSLELARRYWPEGKQLGISGPEGQMEYFMFTRSGLPLEFHVDVSRHSPLPTSPAVEAQKIFDLFNAATSAGQPLPIEWLKNSLDAGRALPLPKSGDQVQMSKAQIENVLLSQGEPVMPDYYDDDYIHILIHRQAQMQSPDENLQQFLEMHIQMHSQNMMMKKPTQGNQVPNMQGGHGVEAQQGAVTSQEGLAQSAAGEAPLQQPTY